MYHKRSTTLALWVLTMFVISLFTPVASARIIYNLEEGTTNADTFTIDFDDSSTSNIDLRFGDAIGETLTWDVANDRFNLSDDLRIDGDFSQSGTAITLDAGSTVDNTVRIIANQGIDDNGELRYNPVTNRWEISNDGNTFVEIGTAAGGNADTLDNLDSTQFLRSDTSDNYTNGTLTFDAGTTMQVNGVADLSGSTQIIIPNTDSNTFTLDQDNTGGNVSLQFGNTLGETIFWNATAGGGFEISDALTVGGPLSLNGTIQTFDADNTASDNTIRIVANQGVDNDGELRYNPVTDRWEISNDGGVFNNIAVDGQTDADTLDGLDSTQFLRSDTSDNYTNGTLTFDAGTTLDSDGNVDFSGATQIIIPNTTSNTFVLDQDDTGGDVVLQFGTTLNERMFWDDSATAFALTDDLNILGGISFTSTADFNQQMAHEMVFDNGSAFPVAPAPVEGQTFYRTDLNSFFIFDGTTWQSLGGSSDDATLFFAPEYEDATVNADGSNNRGTLSSDRDLANFRNFYEWNVRRTVLHDIDIVLEIRLPDDFGSFQATPLQLDFKTEDTDVTDNQIDVTVFDTADTADPVTGGADLVSAVADTWQTASITGLDGTYTAGDRMTIVMKLHSRRNNGAAGADPRSAFVGNLRLNYNKQ